MYHLGKPASRNETRRYRTAFYSYEGMIALLLAALLMPTRGMLAAAAIAGLGLLLMGVQHLISRQLSIKSAKLIDKQEALLASYASSAPWACRSGFIRSLTAGSLRPILDSG